MGAEIRRIWFCGLTGLAVEATPRRSVREEVPEQKRFAKIEKKMGNPETINTQK
jgi:hypothetical protein